MKIRALKKYFGNHWANPNLLYVVSGKPIPLDFVRRARKRGCRVVLNQNGVYTPSWYPGDFSAQNAVFRGYHELADHVFYQSQFCLDCVRLFVGPQVRPHEVLHNAVETRPGAARTSLMGPLRVLSANYFNRAKAYLLDALFETIAHLHAKDPGRYRFILAGKIDNGLTGRAPTARWMNELFARRGVQSCVTYAGPYGFRERGALFGAADVFLHLVYNDASPNIVLEAMAEGLPVVYGQSGGTPELVGEAGVGLPVPSSFDTVHTPSPEAVGQALGSVESRYSEWSRAAVERVAAHFSMEKWLVRHETVMRELVERNRR